MNRTRIPWCDYTWNPIVGCSKISEGCVNCYAAAMARRFHWPWGKPVFMEKRIHEPAHIRKPSRIFVCSTSDFFHGKCEPIWQDFVGVEMAHRQKHTFILLTKRPNGIRQWLDRMISDGLWPLNNVWIGVTIESQEHEWRWDELRKAWNGIRFISVEPMLSKVTMAGWEEKPDWVIAGPETGPKKRYCADAWIDALSDESPCFFDKRNTWARREFPQEEVK